MPAVESVVFDIGETLLDDTREFGSWADWIGVPRHTFSAVLGAVTAEGRNNAEAFEYFRPDFDLIAERAAREAAGMGEQIGEQDLYPDVRPALSELRERGIWVGIAGNQTVRAADLLRRLALPCNAVATSGEWGVAKPDAAFFDRIAQFAPSDRGSILYVGDHPDNDLIPARTAGMRCALIRRGPLGHLFAERVRRRGEADWIIDSLHDLLDVVG